MSVPKPNARYGVVVPVKRLPHAKSRLAPLGDDARIRLVSAFVGDTVEALLACPAVDGIVVVTDEISLVGDLRELGAIVIPDGESGRLNPALVQGAAELIRLFPEARPVALCADLPCLDAGDLSVVLSRVPEEECAFVADAAGVGTTLYTAPGLAQFVPRFGAESRRAHLAAGAVEIPADDAVSVTRDVDTPEDLTAALDLGVGPRTSWVATSLGLARRETSE